MTPEKLDELEPWVDWPTISRADLLDLLATARREAALREALEKLIDSADQYERETRGRGVWSDGSPDATIIRGIQQYRRALLSEVPQ